VMEKARNRFANLQNELRKVDPSDERKYKVIHYINFISISLFIVTPSVRESVARVINGLIMCRVLIFFSMYANKPPLSHSFACRRFKIRLFKNTKRTTMIAHFKIRSRGMYVFLTLYSSLFLKTILGVEYTAAITLRIYIHFQVLPKYFHAVV
jgi:hypothetical protein